MTIPFQSSAAPTLGVEMELQIIDPETGNLTPRGPELVAFCEEHPEVGLVVKPELVQATIEINTGICKDVAQVERDLTTQLTLLRSVCRERGVSFLSAGTHPFARWRERQYTQTPRYRALVDKHVWTARRMQIYGLHVHVGMPDGETAIQVINQITQYAPMLLALSANSPFWEGDDTGLDSCRTKVFENLSSAGLPFRFENWEGYENLIQVLLETGSIGSQREIWWDIRPHSDFGTIEVRICDATRTLAEVLALTALVQCLAVYFRRLYENGEEVRLLHPGIIRENKWRACRWGLEGELIDPLTLQGIPTRKLIEQTVGEMQPLAAELGCSAYLAGIFAMLASGNGATRQRRIHAQTRSLVAVVADLEAGLAT
ncbi:glutamate--cysteine ligase [Gloeobacter morelensis]|uniref:Putative glutamate--cysteine ligase 2 n=1 Tax=Gloeobacter morelensis MG652769 TaxID=2781736 RepID=A0ABY3PN31_9CYAN|nr:glutamate--cysteine ligase [Gloeobacter morelensis]UFP94807.1 glutamate--cysteine ligase [Gloeobacter morelensis MG652769]